MSLEKYQDMLRFQTIITTQENPVMIRLEKEKYINKDFLETVKEYIIQKNQEDFIDYEIRNIILTYLNYFKEYSKEVEKKELNELINECIMECNLCSIVNDVDLYYANEFYIRTGEYKTPNWFYCNIKNGDYNNSTIYELMQKDEYYLYCLLYQDKKQNIEDNIYSSEQPFWSAHRFLNDVPELQKNEKFLQNCNDMCLFVKDALSYNVLIGKNLGFIKRFKYEVKSLQKKLR